jgi:hypothetical protein
MWNGNVWWNQLLEIPPCQNPGNEVGICLSSTLKIENIANQSIFDMIRKRD